MIEPGAYIRRETGISIVINTVFSFVFFMVVFGQADVIPVWGVGAYAFDFIPQSFMIALMSALVPGALTARRLRAGAVSRLDTTSRLPASLFARAILIALTAAIVGTGLAALVLKTSGAESIPWTPALLIKLLSGAGLAAIVTPIGLRAALANTTGTAS